MCDIWHKPKQTYNNPCGSSKSENLSASGKPQDSTAVEPAELFMHMYALSLLVKRCLRSDAGQQRTVASTGAIDYAVKTSTCCCCYCLRKKKEKEKGSPSVQLLKSWRDLIREKLDTVVVSEEKLTKRAQSRNQRLIPVFPPSKRVLQK